MPKLKKELRTRQVKIMFTEAEYEQLMAKKDRHHLASWMRETCLKNSENKRIIKVDNQLIMQIARIGNNLNQLAKYAHENNTLHNKVFYEIGDCRKQLSLIVETLIKQGGNHDS